MLKIEAEVGSGFHALKRFLRTVLLHKLQKSMKIERTCILCMLNSAEGRAFYASIEKKNAGKFRFLFYLDLVHNLNLCFTIVLHSIICSQKP